jgi:hypothetical protein
MMLALVHCMVVNAFKGIINLMSLAILGNSCNLHTSTFETLIKNNHKVKFIGLTEFLYMKKILPDFLNVYQLFSVS